MAEVLYVMHKGKKTWPGNVKAAILADGTRHNVRGGVAGVIHKGARYAWPQGEATLLVGYQRGVTNFCDTFQAAFPQAKSFARSASSPPQGAATTNLAAAGQPEVLAWDGGQGNVLCYSGAATIYAGANTQIMFARLPSLQTLDLSGFDTSKVTDMQSMFMLSPSLQSLDLSSFDTSKVTGMSNMFYGCTSLQTLDLSSFDTSKVTDMSNMFYGCTSLQTLDLSGFDTSKVSSYGYIMFQDCPALQTVYASAANAEFLRNSMTESGNDPSIIQVVR